MKTAIGIVKSSLIPKLEKVSNFDYNKVPEFFWEQFTEYLLVFESNSKPIYKLILDLELDSEVKEKLISKIPGVFSKLVKELAEAYVHGNTSKAIEVLLKSKGQLFKTEVEFFYALSKAIRIAEQNRIRAELPFFFEKLKNEISDSSNKRNDLD